MYPWDSPSSGGLTSGATRHLDGMKPAILDGHLHFANALAGGLCFGLRHGTLLLQLAKIACQGPWKFYNKHGLEMEISPSTTRDWMEINRIMSDLYIYMDFDMFGCKSSRIIIHQTLLAGKLLIKISQIWSWTIHRLVVAEVAWSIISCHPAWDTSHEVPGSARVWR